MALTSANCSLSLCPGSEGYPGGGCMPLPLQTAPRSASGPAPGLSPAKKLAVGLGLCQIWLGTGSPLPLAPLLLQYWGYWWRKEG